MTENSRKDVFVVKDEAVSMHDSLEVDSKSHHLLPAESKKRKMTKTEKAPLKRKRAASVLDDEDFEPDIKIIKEEPSKAREGPKNLDDEFDEEEEPGFVSELDESEVDSDDIEDNDASDMDISGVENRDNSDDSDYYGTAKDKAEAKRKKMRASRAERSARRARIAAEAAHMLLGDKIYSMLKFMRKKEKSNKSDGQSLIFDLSEVKKEVKDISIDAAMPILLGLDIIERANNEEDEDEDPTFYWCGFKHEGIKERLLSILSEEDDQGQEQGQDQGQNQEEPSSSSPLRGKDDDEKAWILCKKALRVVLKLPAGQAIATAEIFHQIGGDYEAGESQEKLDNYSKMSNALRVLQVRVVRTLKEAYKNIP